MILGKSRIQPAGAMQWAGLTKKEQRFIKPSIPVTKDLNSLIAFIVFGTVPGTQ